MEVHFTPEQMVQISQIAAHSGKAPERVAKEAVLRVVEEDTRFGSARARGIEQAHRGELIDHDEVVARIERRLQSR